MNACGIWAPQVAAMVGAFTPSVPVDHQHIALEAVDGHELPRDMPCFRDTDNLVYGKSEAGGDPLRRLRAGPGRALGGRRALGARRRALPPDHERFAQLMDGAVRRFPFLRDAGVVALVCHPDAMTPDGNPLLGPMPGRAGVLDGRRPLAERLRRRRRHRQDGRRVDHDGRDRARRDRLPRLALRRRRTAIRASRRRRPARSTATTTASATRSTSTSGAGRSGSRRCTGGSRSSARSSGRRTGGSARTTSSRGSRAGGRAPTSARSASRSRPGSSGSASSTRRSASASGSST